MNIKKATVIVSNAREEIQQNIELTEENLSFSADGTKVNINVGNILGNEIVLSLEVEEDE